MQNLKPLYDAVIAAEAKVASIQKEMLESFESGTQEGKEKAMELRPALDEAKAGAVEANQLYLSMRDSDAQENGHARMFVPVPDSEKNAGQGKQLPRAEFEALDAAEKMAFALKGGIIVE